jgi:hypothetical protein
VVAAELLRGSLLKKFRGSEKQRKLADAAALDLFLSWNARCEAWVEPEPVTETDAILLGEFRSCFMKCFELPGGELLDFSSLVPCYFRVGPGAAVDAKLTDLYTKLYAGDMSTTSDDLYWHYYDSTLPYELENEAERIRSASFRTTVVRGSNLGFAAKNAEISRTRTTEPSLPMVYQLATGKVLEDVIRQRYGVDLATQPDCNRELSRIGSLSREVSTTDLSSASDATAVKLFKWAMPYREIQNWFLWIRSDRAANPLKKGEWIDLHVLSSMGNGFTFPLMTLLFLCVVEAVYRHLDIPMIKNKIDRRGNRTTPGNFGVFGDDIIVDSRAFQLVNHLLEMLGYVVNREKSFGPHENGTDGSFRESCGTDWFLGHNVRGVYCKTLDTPQRRYTLINRLNAWSAEWDIPLPDTIGFLMKTVWYLPVPPWEASDSGVVVPLSLFQIKKRDAYGGICYTAMKPIEFRWNPARGLTEKHTDKKGGLDWYREVLFGTSGSEGCHDGALVRVPYNPFVNSFGLVLTAVQGTYRNGGITARSNEGGPLYKKTRETTPGWEWSNESTVGFTPSGWARFEKTLASVNLGRKHVSAPT